MLNDMKTIESLFTEIESTGIAQKLFLNLEGQDFSYGDLYTQSRKMAGYFNELSLQKGDRIFLILDESWETILLYLSAMRCGITPSIINPETGTIRLKSLQELAQAKAIFLKPELVEKYSLDAPHVIPVQRRKKSKGKLFKKLLKRKNTTEEGPTTFLDQIDALEPFDFPTSIAGDTIAYIIFTSGTTGLPKGVEITHNSLMSHLATFCKVYEIDQQSALLNILRWYQIDGLAHGTLLALFSKASMFRPFNFEINKIGLLLSSIYKHRISHFIAVPTLLNLLDQYGSDYTDSFDGPDFKYVISTAAKLEPQLWQKFQDKFGVKIINAYGLSETVAGSIYAAPVLNAHHVGALGKPADCQVKVVDQDGKETAVDETGELVIKGDHVMKGYLNQPELTAEVLKEGWFYTGDLAYKDEQGLFFINGRKKELVISGGVNIHPQEVSEILNLNEAVLESACLGWKDPVFDQKLVAAVVLKPGQKATVTSLIEHCRKHLESVKIPHEIYFLDTLPRTISGKIDLNALKAKIEESTMIQAPQDTSITKGVFAAAAAAFKIPQQKLSIEDTPQSLEGWDSMNHLQFIVSLEQQYKFGFLLQRLCRLKA